jgi:two-component system, OmpR family, phosphate regulon sensor histidine kinase PhoR
VTIWVWSLLATAAAFIVGYIVWRRWIAPWRSLETLVREITHGKRPRTFLIGGANEPRRIGLALEDLFSRQQQLDQQLAERVSGTQTIAAAMQDGLMVVDANHRIRLANRAFSELFGLSGNVPVVPLLEVVRIPEVDQLIMDTLQSGEPQRQELELSESPNRVARFLQLSAVATRTDAGEITGAVVLFHDISQLKQTDEIRRDFVANVSHELRTPLSILQGYIETLLEDRDLSGDELNRILEVMKRHSDRLSALTDDLLSLARLESGHSNLQLQDVRLSELFASIVRDWGKRFAEKKLSVDVAVSPSLPVIQADPTRLQEILYNLLDNAVKYSHPGGKIRLEATHRDHAVEINVTDTGIGIPEADLPRIFERFYRADKARSRELGGTGLGLSIVKHIAQMHGGVVNAESTAGRGTTIRVSLPIKEQRNTGPVTES